MWIWSCPVIRVYFSFEQPLQGENVKKISSPLNVSPWYNHVDWALGFISLQHSTAKIGLSEQYCPKYCGSVLCNKLRNTWHGDQGCQSTACLAVHFPFFLTEAAARKWDQIPSCVSTVCVGGGGSMTHALKWPVGTHMHTNVHMVMQNVMEKSFEFDWSELFSSCYTRE